MSAYHDCLKEAYAKLGSHRYIVLPNHPYVGVEDLFLYLVDKEGIENLPLYLDAHFLRLRKTSTCQYPHDESEEWCKLILEKLSNG